MNRKGFTLVEVLAVIIVIALVFTLVAPSISDVYENSKLKSEEIQNLNRTKIKKH